MGEYTVKINNTVVPFTRIWFEKRHPSKDPDTFSIDIDYDAVVNPFDVVRIYNDDTLEFYGFVEKIEQTWSEDGRSKRISGRCRKVILWKKFIERFERAKLNGFFGAVNPSKLVHFLLYSPKSDDPATSSVFHRIGYGIDLYSASFSANRTNPKTHPSYVKLRQSGFAWRLGFKTGWVVIRPNEFTWDTAEWDTYGTEPWINTDDGDDSYIEEDTIGHQMIKFKFENVSGWRSGTAVTAAYLMVKMKKTGSQDYAGVKIYISTDGGQTWKTYYYLSTDSTEYVTDSDEISDSITTLEELNNLAIKIEYVTGDGIRITEVKVSAYLVETEYQRTGDYFKIDLGSVKSNVYAILIECRKNVEYYARNYKILTSTDGTNWTLQASKSDNQCRDILEVWEPTDVRYIKIEITADADYRWEISQIFIWQAEDSEYRVIGNNKDQIANIFIEDYNSPINPVSFSFMRLSEALGRILDLTHENYIPWEWWIPHKEEAEFHVASRKGSDKSSSVIFEKGKHFESLTYTKIIRDTFQRVRVVGKAEGRKQETTAMSEWKMDTNAVSEVGTAYEKVFSRRSIDNKDAANTYAEVLLKENAYPIEEITFTLGYDEFEGQYDVGDDVKVVDEEMGINGSYRIHRIEKEIRGEEETVTITLSTKWKDIADEWAEIRRELREAELAGTTIADWVGEGSQQSKLDAEELTDIWSVTAKNDEKTAPKDENDPSWSKLQEQSGNELLCNDDWFVVKGHKVAGMQSTYYVWINEPTIPFNANPKFVMEIKIPNEESDTNNPTTWNAGDYIYLRMYGNDKGFGFYIEKETFEGHPYCLRVILTDAGGPQSVAIMGLDENVKYRLEADVDWEARIVKFKVDNELKAILAFDDDENGENTGMYPLYISFTNTQPDPVEYYPQIYIYRYKSQWVWTK